jgi:hypothetical protein
MRGRAVSADAAARRTAIDLDAPPERLAAFRLLIGGFALAYVLIRLPVFAGLRDRPADAFDAVGVLAALRRPLPDAVVLAVIAVTVVAGIAFTAGAAFRASGPVFAVGMLALCTYRSSWGQLLHFENLMVLFLLVVGFSPAADTWAVGAGRRAPRSRGAGAYGWPLALAATVMVVTYVIAGIAKLRYGGLEWITSDTLRNHVAYSATRLDLLGGTPSPLAAVVVPRAWLFPPMAAATVAIELLAPVALLSLRWRTPWVLAAWTMHVGIWALMLVGFPMPLFGVAFAPLYRLERLDPRTWRASARQPAT